MNNDLNKKSLNPYLIPKFVNILSIPPIFKPKICRDKNNNMYHKYDVYIKEIKAQMLPPCFPKTLLYAYGGLIYNDKCYKGTECFFSVPGPTFESVRYIPNHVHWINLLNNPQQFPVDPTLHWSDPNNIHRHLPTPFPPFPPGFPLAQYPIPTVTHLHGGETAPAFDGYPESWFTSNGIKGPTYFSSCYKYLNTQPPTTLWYHDHALGVTRLNVYGGLSGYYIIRDFLNPLDNPKTTPFPKGKYEIPILIQDKSFYDDGSLSFPTAGTLPCLHPYWMPEFFGDSIVVNGKVWPKLNVEKTAYRLRILNGSNARFYNLKFSNGMTFYQIGTDGGYLPKPIELNELILAPAERADIIIDFSNLSIGTELILENSAPAPFPMGDLPDPKTTGIIMKFVVYSKSIGPIKPLKLPCLLNTIPKLTPNRPKRSLALVVLLKDTHISEILLDGQKWSNPISENPLVGSTEVWELINTTPDNHPIHVHLVQFQILNRQDFDITNYTTDWLKINGTPPFTKPTIPLPVDKYLVGNPISPDLNEFGWKDTIKCPIGQVTRIIIRYSPIDANPCKVRPKINLYPFDPTASPGYVWHCHILDHEDNEMMRPYIITK